MESHPQNPEKTSPMHFLGKSFSRITFKSLFQNVLTSRRHFMRSPLKLKAMQQIQQRSVKRSNFVEPGYNYLTCHNNFPFNSQSNKVYFSHYSNTVLSKLPG